MSVYDGIDISRLPPPELVEPLDYETILARKKARVLVIRPDLADTIDLETEPLHIALQVAAEDEISLRARVNDAAKGVTLAFARGDTLSHLGLGHHRVPRLVLDAGDPDAIPPVPEVLEPDDRYRARCQMAWESWTTAGSIGSYQFHAMTAQFGAEIARDVSVVAPSADDMLVLTVLSMDNDGAPSAGLLATIADATNAQLVRPLNDTVVVQEPEFLDYTITALLDIEDGPDPALVLAAALADLDAYVQSAAALGTEIAPGEYAVRVARSGIDRALHQPNVRQVTLTGWAGDIAPTPYQSARCLAIDVQQANA